MIWGCMTANGVSELRHIDVGRHGRLYVAVLEATLLQSRRKPRLPRDWVFMQDNDPKHMAKKSRSWLERNGVEVLKWPANSPDLNPIENLWTELEKGRQELDPKVKGAALFKDLQAQWKAIPAGLTAAGRVDARPVGSSDQGQGWPYKILNYISTLRATKTLCTHCRWRLVAH